MPFLNTAPASRPLYELLEVQDVGAYSKTEAKRERDFAIRFKVCFLAAVLVGSFLFFTAMFYLMPVPMPV